MLTPNDLVNPARKSGYNHVNHAGGVGQGKRTGKPWKSGVRTRNGGYAWRSPRRATPLEAAQDYCDYVNGQHAATPATLMTAGHEYIVDERDTDPEYQAALGVIRDRTAQRREGRQGYVYLITDGEYLKIGYSVNPEKRVAELQTGNARPLRLLGKIEGTEADERALHQKYIRNNVLQEWFHINGPLLQEFVNQPAAVQRAA